MQIDRSFIDGDIRGAIAYMRAHEQFADVLPAYAALFENAEYRTYDVPDGINDILRRYQIYLRDMFYCGVPEAEAADRLLAGLRALTGLPEADEAALAGRLGSLFAAAGYLRCSAKRRDITVRIFGGTPSRRFTASSCRTARRNIPSTS